MKPHTLKRVTIIKNNINEVFNFFSKAENLNRITPSVLEFKIIPPIPTEMKKETIISYQLKLKGIAFNWKSEITKWEPPYLFEDTQIKGPYKLWIHEHRFEEGNGVTHVNDTVSYLSPGGIFEFIPHILIVKKKVKDIFDYREKSLIEIFK